MMAEQIVTYHAVLMDRDCEILGQLDTVDLNPRYVVLVPTPGGVVVLAGDDEPEIDDLPVGARTFHRLGSAVYTSALEASCMYESLRERL